MMTEQELFEQRLRAALRRHTADAPVMFDALDFAHAAATRAPRRRGLARVVAWRLAPAPMPAWVIVTVLLLTAMVAGCSSSARGHRRSSRPWCRPSASCSPVRPGRHPTSPARSTRPGRPRTFGGMRGIRPPGRQVRGSRGHPHGQRGHRRRDVDVRRLHERLDADAPESGAVQLGRRARLRRRLRHDDPGHLPRGMGLRPPGRHLDVEGLRPSDRPVVFDPRDVLGLRPGHRPRRCRGSRDRRGSRVRGVPPAGAVELRRRHRHVDPDPPGRPGGHRGSRGALRLRRLRGQDGRVRSHSIR